MAELSLPPLEQAVVAYLKSATGKPVVTRVPNPRPDSFVRIRRQGGTRVNLVQNAPNLLVEVWGSGNEETVKVHPWELAKQTWEALAQADEVDFPRGVDVMRVSITELVDYPDEASGTPRYTFIFTPTVNLN